MLRILIVEDNVRMLDNLKYVFEQNEKFELIGGVTNKIDAVELARQHMPQIILIDINLEANDKDNQDGIVAIREIRQFATMNEIKIFVLTGENNIYIKAKAAGANGFFTKPVNFESMINMLLGTIENHTAADESQAYIFKEEFLRPLTPKQRDVAEELLNDLSNEEIAEKLDIKLGTVKSHTNDIYKVYSVSGRVELKEKYSRRSI